MQVLLLRYLCLVTITANVNKPQANPFEPTDTSALENQPSPVYSEIYSPLSFQIIASLHKARNSKDFFMKEMDYNANAIKFCDLLVQKHKFKNSLSDLSGIETSKILSNFKNDIDASIKSVLNAFEETRDACCTQLQDDHFASIRVFNIYNAAQVGQIAKCDAFKRSSFATYGDIEKFTKFFENFQNRYVYDCVKLKIFDFAESCVLLKNVASYIKFLVYQLSNPSLKEPSSTDIEDARDDTLEENESTLSNPSVEEPLSTDIEDASDDNLEENESTLSNPSVEEPLTTNIDDASDDTLKDNESSKSNPLMNDSLSKDFENVRDDNLAENENTFSNPSMKEPLITDFEKAEDDTLKDNESVITKPSMKEPLSTDIEDARDDTLKENENTFSNPPMKEPLTTNIDDASDDTLKDNESSKSNPPMKDPLSKDFEDARDDTLKENENTFSNPPMKEPLTTNIDDAINGTVKDNGSTMSNPPMKESLSTDIEDASDDNLEDNEGSTSSSNNSWVYVE